MRILVVFIALASPAWAAPPTSAPARSASRPAASRPLTDEPGAPVLGPQPRPAPSPASSSPRRATEYRFDALRIDGTLRGPEALDVRSSLTRDGSSLARLRRSFVHRVLETVEAPGLHGGH